MSRYAALVRGRAAAEAGMADTCTITRSGPDVVDDNTGEITHTKEQIYTGKCRIQARPAAATDQTPGQDHQLLVRLELQLPIEAPILEVGDQVEMTAAAYDPQLVGQVFRVRDLMAKTDATARRVGITRRTS